jgi:hypothetical protein
MRTEVDQHLETFLAKVNHLLSDIEEWSRSAGLATSQEEISITEEACGTYKTRKLLIQSTTGARLAEVIPISAWVLGANGRVDLKGIFDTIILVDLDAGGPTLTSTITTGNHQETHTRHFYRGIDEPGWYWIESKVSGRGHKLSRELFLDLLAEVSDYECD